MSETQSTGDAPGSTDPIRAQIEALRRVGPGRTPSDVEPIRLELALWNVSADAIRARPAEERANLLLDALEQRERTRRLLDGQRQRTGAAGATVEGDPLAALDAARAAIEANGVRKSQAEARLAEVRAQVAGLRAELSQLRPPVEPRRVDALLSGSAELPTDSVLRERADRAAVLQGKLVHLEDDERTLAEEVARSERAARALQADAEAAEVACLRVLEEELFQLHREESLRFVSDVLLPMRAVALSLQARKQALHYGEAFNGLHLTVMGSAPASPGSDRRSRILWAGIYPGADLPPELHQAAEEWQRRAAVLIEGLRGGEGAAQHRAE